MFLTFILDFLILFYFILKNKQKKIGAGPGQSYPRIFVRVNEKNLMVFSGENASNGRELWISDGTTAGTKLLADVRPGPQSSDPQDFMMIGYINFNIHFRI